MSARKNYVEAAKRMYSGNGDDCFEIDDDANISPVEERSESTQDKSPKPLFPL